MENNYQIHCYQLTETHFGGDLQNDYKIPTYIPADFKYLGAGMKNGFPCLWYLVNLASPCQKRAFVTVRDQISVPGGNSISYVDTVVSYEMQGELRHEFAIHVFEVNGIAPDVNTANGLVTHPDGTQS